jgi:pyruvate,water dikinase
MPASELDQMEGKQLVQHYRDLESQLLQRWDAPLINDFFAMIHYGTLRSLCEKWLGDASLQNTLLLDTGDIISAEPPRRIKEMATIAAKDASLTSCLANPDVSSEVKIAQLMQSSKLAEFYKIYLEKFGDRCLEELKLESPTVVDDPTSLLSGIGGMAQRIRSGKVPQKPQVFNVPEIKLSGMKSVIFKWVLQNAKSRVRDRENLRFERTRLFGRVRKIVVLLGHKLANDSWIDDPQEVFYLTISGT